MKIISLKLGLILLTALLTVPLLVAAEPGQPVERVMFKDGKVLFVQAGKTIEATNELALGKGIAVLTNGTFTVLKGKARPFRDGDVLGADGTLTGSDGSIAPVVDHIIMKDGRPTLVLNGEPTALTSVYRLGDGTSILPDATVIAPNGLRSRLLDGELRKLDGTSLPVKDSISLQGGKVVVQKDGSPLTVPPGQSMMMSDGTKVFGNGTVLKSDGTRLTLKEGDILPVEGVERKR
jgi:hypothetical protein